MRCVGHRSWLLAGGKKTEASLRVLGGKSGDGQVRLGGMAASFQFPQRGGAPGHGSAPGRPPRSRCEAAATEQGECRLPKASARKSGSSPTRRAHCPWVGEGPRPQPGKAGDSGERGRAVAGAPGESAKFEFAVGPGRGPRGDAGPGSGRSKGVTQLRTLSSLSLSQKKKNLMHWDGYCCVPQTR